MDFKFFCQFDSIVDTRTPKEFAESHIPNAINVPSLFDEERVNIGTLYKKDAFTARQNGAALLANNIAAHLTTTFKDKPQQWHPLVYCARGGQRSDAMVDILKRVGWQATQLEGGYKNYRQQVLMQLRVGFDSVQFVVIGGKTGVGKTRVLNQLAAQNVPVLDLECLASHRGSVFGEHISQPSQRQFDNLLCFYLQRLPPNKLVFIEAESPRIGKIQLPPALMKRMREGVFLRLEASLNDRVELILQEYSHFLRDDALFDVTTKKLTPFLGRVAVDGLRELYQKKQWAQIVKILLVEHYDKRYERALQQHYATAKPAFFTTTPTDDGSVATTVQSILNTVQ